MKLSKDQRYTAYCIMLEELEDENSGLKYNGFCWLIGQLFMNGESVETDGWLDSVKYFRELKRKKPKKILPWGSWFYNNEYGIKKRIAILKKCIQETENF